jgi:hypothetical protein
MRDELLAWYYDGAEGDLGRHAMSLEPTSHGEGQAHPGFSTRAVEAATRYREVDEALHELDHHHRRTLARYYAVPPPSVVRLYDGLGDALCVVLGLVEDHAALASMLVSSRTDKAARVQVEELKDRAERMVIEAHGAYRSARAAAQAAERHAIQARRQALREAMMRGTTP